jgi:hypothetical protein
VFQRTIAFFIIIVFTAILGAENTGETASLKKMVFEEKRIEGKIRRPQLVLIQAEQRPVFEPMILQSLGNKGDITGSVDRNIIENIPNQKHFVFEDKRIINIVP